MPTWSRLHESEITPFAVSGSYDAFAGMLAITRKYEMDGGEMEQAIGGVGFQDWCFQAQIPCSPEEYGINTGGIPTPPATAVYTAQQYPVTMYAVQFTPTRRTNGVMLVDVLYEGHRNGWLRTEWDPATRSLLTIQDLNGYQIGASAEGTQRILPVFQFSVTENFSWDLPGTPNGATRTDLINYLNLVCQPLVTTCNENGWTCDGIDPAITSFFTSLPISFTINGQPVVNSSGQWIDGWWQYMGPKPVRNRDGSMTLVHTYRNDCYAGQIETRRMCQDSWWFTRGIQSGLPGVNTKQRITTTDTNWPAVGSPGYTVTGPNGEHLNYLYPVAGNTVNGVAIPTWKSSFRFSIGYNGVFASQGFGNQQ